MKKILAATDFSDAAHNATVYALELAKSFDAELIIYSAYQEMPIILPEMPVLATPEDMHRFINEQLKQTVVQLGAGDTVEITTICSERSSAQGIVETAKANNVDIIIMGMKEAGKGFRKVFGSTVSSLINKTTIPVLIIPENIQYKPITSIALANEEDLPPDTDAKVLNTLEDLATRFQSNLYIVRVAKDKLRAALGTLYSPSRIKRMTRELKPVYESVEGKNVTEGLNQFVSSHKVDLLVTLSHQHTLVAQWLGNSATRNLLFELSVPLLVVPIDNEDNFRFKKFREEIIL